MLFTRNVMRRQDKCLKSTYLDICSSLQVLASAKIPLASPLADMTGAGLDMPGISFIPPGEAETAIQRVENQPRADGTRRRGDRNETEGMGQKGIS